MGYDVERFVGYVNEGLLCCVCRAVLEEPLQAPCEHAFCSSCIHAWLLHHHTCPEDRLPLDIASLRPIHRYMRNDLARLQVRCVYGPQGCEVICALESLQRHEQQCDFALLSCRDDDGPVQVSRRYLEAHLCVCDYQSSVCAGPVCVCLPACHSPDQAQHNCISELRAELHSLRLEHVCKVEEVRLEMESRLDSQRRHMVQKESLLKSEVDDLKGQLSRVMTDIRVLLGADRARRQELERAELEKAELLELLKKESLRPTLPLATPMVTLPAEGPRKPTPRNSALDYIKSKEVALT
ncbi:RING finger protein 151 [Brachyhypopomus gauderio]|uniref:RING finger protein 151 n=1 Tax=Brachyhypopomus gauderio TaxID=698409 RepID=UPI004042A168